MKLLRCLSNLFVLFFAVFLLCGCDSIDRVVWSGDGKQAVVLCRDGMRLGTPDGALSSELVENVRAAQWLPDSKGLVFVSRKRTGSWAELKAAMDNQAVSEAQSTARIMKQEMLNYSGDWDKFLDNTPSLKKAARVPEALMFLKEKESEMLRKKLKDKWSDVEKLSLDVSTLATAPVSGETLGAKRTLLKAMKDILELRVARDGRSVLATVAGEDKDYELWVVSMADGTKVSVMRGCGRFPDWETGSRSIVFTRGGTAVADSKTRMGALVRRQVWGADGQPVKVQSKESEEELLANISFNSEGRVRCLKDGTIFFTSKHDRLPSTPKDDPLAEELFALRPGKYMVDRVVTYTAAHLIGDTAQYFDVNPSGTHVVIPGGRNTILNLADGSVTNLDSLGFAPRQAGLYFQPHWRNDDELCFAGFSMTGDSKHKVDVMLWSQRKQDATAISATWPEEALKGWIQ